MCVGGELIRYNLISSLQLILLEIIYGSSQERELLKKTLGNLYKDPLLNMTENSDNDENDYDDDGSDEFSDSLNGMDEEGYDDFDFDYYYYLVF